MLLMIASTIKQVKEEKLQVGIFNFAMIFQCLKEMTLLHPVLPGTILIKTSILNLVKINLVWHLSINLQLITSVENNLNLTFKMLQISFLQMVTLIHGIKEVSTQLFHLRLTTFILKMQLIILIFSQKILVMIFGLKPLVNKSKPS